MSLKRAAECVKKYDNFLITSHTSPEGDALGSELAFHRLVNKLGKKAVILNEDKLPYGYDFLPGKENIRQYKDNLKNIKFDCFVTLDCSDLSRTGEVYRINALPKKPILNIDHHISNQNFGDINWVEPDSSSCSEMIYKLYRKLGVAFDRDSAMFLYVGMLTDTGSFRYSNTNSLTHKAASEFFEFDLDAARIYRNIYENIPVGDMRLLSKILPTMRRFAGGRIIWFQIQRKLLKGRKLYLDLSETLLSFARAVKGVEVAVLFKENLGVKDEIRVNLRSQGRVDVNKVAAFFGGGGHKTASGATIKGNIGQIRKKVLGRIAAELKL